MADLVLVRRGNKFENVHPLEMKPGDIDCRAMTDEEFEREVCRALGIFKFCPPQVERPAPSGGKE